MEAGNKTLPTLDETAIATTTPGISTTEATATTAQTTTTTTSIPKAEKNKWVEEEGIRLGDAFSPAVIKLDSGIYRMLASAGDEINAYVSGDGLKYVLEKKKVIYPATHQGCTGYATTDI